MPEPTTEATPNTTAEGAGNQVTVPAVTTGTTTPVVKLEEPEKKFTQEDLDRIAGKARQEERDKLQAAKDKEERERLEAEATKQGEFEKLANDRKAEIDKLNPKLAAAETERDALKVTLVEIAEAGLKELPKEVMEIAPVIRAEDKSLTNPLDVLAWLPKGKALAEKLNGTSATKGTPVSPRANGTKPNPDADKQARAVARQAYRD